jgi:NTE family protein
MWRDEAWLTDPDMDQRVADALRGKASLNIDAPLHPYYSIFDLVGNAFKDFLFLVGDGQALLKSMDVVMSKARALFNLDPIRERMATSFNMAAINQWAANGGKLRLAVVALDSGKLRFVTEDEA